VDAATSPDPLRLSECPSCGYALEGLAPEGRCPECGVEYRPGVIVQHNHARDDGVGAAGSEAVSENVNVVIAAYFVSKWNGRRFDWFDLLWSGDMPWLVQIWLGPGGARQVNNPTSGTITPGPVTPWDQIEKVRIDSVNGERARVRLTGPTSFWRGRRVMYAEVQCGRERAAAVSHQVEAWRAAARRSKSAAPA
jgi:hypothetical protein